MVHVDKSSHFGKAGSIVLSQRPAQAFPLDTQVAGRGSLPVITALARLLTLACDAHLRAGHTLARGTLVAHRAHFTVLARNARQGLVEATRPRSARIRSTAVAVVAIDNRPQALAPCTPVVLSAQIPVIARAASRLVDTSGGRVAGIQAARIAVIAVHRAARFAKAVAAHVAPGARIPILTGQLRVQVDTAHPFGAHVFRAHVVIFAVQRHTLALTLHALVILGAAEIIVAGSLIPGIQAPRGRVAQIVGAAVAVVAYDRLVLTTGRGVTAIVGAGIPVVTIRCLVGAFPAIHRTSVDSASIAILALHRRPITRTIHWVAEVVGALESVIAVHRLKRHLPGRWIAGIHRAQIAIPDISGNMAALRTLIGQLTAIHSAEVPVVAQRRGHALAYRGITLLYGALVAIVASNSNKNTLAAVRLARVFRTQIVIVTNNRLRQALALLAMIIQGAQVAIITTVIVGQRLFQALTGGRLAGHQDAVIRVIFTFHHTVRHDLAGAVDAVVLSVAHIFILVGIAIRHGGAIADLVAGDTCAGHAFIGMTALVAVVAKRSVRDRDQIAAARLTQMSLANGRRAVQVLAIPSLFAFNNFRRQVQINIGCGIE